MSNDNIYLNNPLHGTSLETILKEVVNHYGFEILYAYLNLNCFNKNASIASSLKFLKKTDWAREKLEAFYMYQYKSLPRASDSEFEKPPRDRIVPHGAKPGEPAELSLEDAERLRVKRAEKARLREQQKQQRPHRSNTKSNGRSDNRNNAKESNGKVDPWSNFRS